MNISDGLPVNRGIHVTIEAKSHPPRSLQAADSILISPNKDVQIALEEIRYARNYRPERPCTESPLDANKRRPAYTFTRCWWYIFHQIFKSRCNCSLLGFEDHYVSNTPVCPPWQAQACFNWDVKYGKDDLRSQAMKLARKHCLIPCREIKYSATVSALDLIKDRAAEALGESPVADMDFYKIQVYFPQKISTNIEETSIVSFHSVVTGFGGLLSLYLSANLVNLIKAIAYAANFIWKKIVASRER